MSGWLWGLLLQAVSWWLAHDCSCGGRELQARVPSVFKTSQPLRGPLVPLPLWHTRLLSWSPWQALELNIHMALWRGFFWKADSFKEKIVPTSPPRLLSPLPLPPPLSSSWFAGLILCSAGPVCAGKAVKMSANQSFREKQWALEGHYPVTKHTPFMECWY